MPQKLKFVSLLFLSLIFLPLIMVSVHAAPPSSLTFPKNKETAAWLWSLPSNNDAKNILAQAKAEGFTTIYLCIDKYLNDQKSLNDFILLAKQNNLSVQALTGDSSWVMPENRSRPLSYLNFIESYNSSHPNAPFAGVHFDIEYYASGLVTSANKAQMSSNFLALVNDIVQTSRSKFNPSSFKLGFAIPFWYDQDTTRVPALYYKLADIVNQYPSSYFAIMAYRPSASASVDLASNEINYANKLENLKIIIGQETMQTSEANVSYYGTSKNTVKLAAADITKTLSSSSSFAGVAIHHLYSYLSLK